MNMTVAHPSGAVDTYTFEDRKHADAFLSAIPGILYDDESVRVQSDDLGLDEIMTGEWKRGTAPWDK